MLSIAQKLLIGFDESSLLRVSHFKVVAGRLKRVFFLLLETFKFGCSDFIDIMWLKCLHTDRYENKFVFGLPESSVCLNFIVII